MSFQFRPYQQTGGGFTPYTKKFQYQQSAYSRGKQFASDWNGKRRSQCRKIEKDGVLYVTGWKIGKRAGFRTFFVAPAKSPVRKVSKSGRVWLSCRVEVVNKTMGIKSLFPGWIEESSKRVFVKSIGIMLNPNSGFISYLPKK